MRHRLLLHRAVNDHLRQILPGNQLERDRNIDRLGQQLLDAFLAQQAAELANRRRVARPAVLEILQPREVLPGRCLGPALDHAFVALVEGVLEIQQRDHQAQRQARTSGLRHPGAHQAGGAAEQVDIDHGLAGAHAAGKEVSDRGLDLLPRHARSQHGQWMAQVDHLVEAAAEEVGRVTHREKLPENRAWQGRNWKKSYPENPTKR